MGEMRVLSSHALDEFKKDFPVAMKRSGDNRIQWDPKNDDEVEIAEMSFDKLTSKGYQAYEVKKDGSKGKKISKFKKGIGMLIMVPAIAGG